MPETEPSSTVRIRERGESVRRHVRGSSLLLVGRFISLGLNLLVQIVAVRYLSQSDYGSFAFAVAVVSLAASMAVFGLDKTVSRFIPIFQEQQNYGKLAGALVLSGSLTAAIGLSIVLIVFGLDQQLLDVVGRDTDTLAVLLILILQAPLSALESLFIALFAAMASARAVFFRRHLLGPGLKLAAVLLAVLLRGDVRFLATAYLAGSFLSVATDLAVFLWLLHAKGMLAKLRQSAVEFPFRDMVTYGFSFFTYEIAFLLRGTIGVMILQGLVGALAVAEFRSVLPIARLNDLVLANFAFLFIPAASRLFAQDNRRAVGELYWRTALWVTVLSFPIFAITFAFADPITVFLLGERYASSGTILGILAVGYYFQAALGFNWRTLRVLEKIRYVFLVDLVVTALSVALYLLLIPAAGALGAALASAATMIVHAVLNQVGLVKLAGIHGFRLSFARAYGVVVLAALVVLAIELLWAPPLFVGIPLVGLLSCFVMWATRDVLDVHATFPELLRLPVFGRLFAAAAPRRSSGRDATPADVDRICQFATQLQHNARHYFPELNGCDSAVELIECSRRAASTLYHFRLGPGELERRVLVKVPTPYVVATAASSASLEDRPRLIGLADPALKFHFESRALHAIQTHFGALNDERFGYVRVLDVLEENRAVLLEKISYPALRTLLLLSALRGKRRHHELVLTALTNAGGWLREFQRIPLANPTSYLATRDDFTAAVDRLADYLVNVGAVEPEFRRRLSAEVKAASSELPSALPTSILHGDYAPRNVLVGPKGQVAVIDTLAFSQVPIYLDVAYFLLALKTSASRIYSGGLLLGSTWLNKLEQHFLRGYFGGETIPYEALQLFEVLTALDKWCSVGDSFRRASGFDRSRMACRLAVRGRFYRRFVERSLSTLAAAKSAPTVIYMES